MLYLEKSFINWRLLSLVKINTRTSDTPCMCSKFQVRVYQIFSNKTKLDIVTLDVTCKFISRADSIANFLDYNIFNRIILKLPEILVHIRKIFRLETDIIQYLYSKLLMLKKYRKTNFELFNQKFK
jgi:hypothetical protein